MIKTKIISLFMVASASSAAWAADVEEMPLPDLKGGVEQAVGVKYGTGQYSIIWDRWRNKVMKAVWEKFCIQLKGGDAIRIGQLYLKTGFKKKIEFPQDLGATYQFTVEENRKIKDAKILKSSDNAEFDALLLRCVKSLEGKPFLDFPEGTGRKQVYLGARLYIKKNGTFRDTNYNDIEKVKDDDKVTESVEKPGSEPVAKPNN